MIRLTIRFFKATEAIHEITGTNTNEVVFRAVSCDFVDRIQAATSKQLKMDASQRIPVRKIDVAVAKL